MTTPDRPTYPVTDRGKAAPRILILVDEPDLGATLVRFLEKLSYAPRVLPSGEAALRFVETESFDLIIADARLPGRIGGLDILRHIRARGRPIPVILCSGRPADLSRDEVLAAGAAQCLAKPFSLADVRVAVERALGEPRPSSGPAT